MTRRETVAGVGFNPLVASSPRPVSASGYTPSGDSPIQITSFIATAVVANFVARVQIG